MPASKSIYLAGPITGLSYDDARNGWRKTFAERLGIVAPHIECFSPMRAKEFLSGHQALECDGASLDKVSNVLARPLGILARDSNDVRERDLIVACFLGATEKASIGTAWEIGYAKALGKPVLVVMEPQGNVHDHVFITHSAGWRTDDLEEAVMIAATVLTPAV